MATESRLLLVEFRSLGCEPCRRLRPQLERLAKQSGQLCRVVSVDVDRHRELAARFQVRATPTLIFFKSGNQLHRFLGGVLPTGVETLMT